jgi:hypothetical protein
MRGGAAAATRSPIPRIHSRRRRLGREKIEKLMIKAVLIHRSSASIFFLGKTPLALRLARAEENILATHETIELGSSMQVAGSSREKRYSELDALLHSSPPYDYIIYIRSMACSQTTGYTINGFAIHG